MEGGNITTLFYAYAFTFIYGNVTSFLTYPTLRLETTAQLNLQQSTRHTIKPVILSGVGQLYKGFGSSLVQYNVKYMYRPYLLSKIPVLVDEHVPSIVLGGLIKAGLYCTIDTVISAPFDNVRTVQLNTNESLSMKQVYRQIYRQYGVQGFFAGSKLAIFKTFPGWSYIFIGYEATKDKREKKDFLSTMMWATLASAPNTILTNPIDVIITHRRAHLLPKEDSFLTSARALTERYGVLSLFKGVSFRLLRRSLSTAAAFVVLDIHRRHD